MKSLLSFLILLFYSSIFAQLNDEKTDLSSLGRIGTISVTIGGDFIITGSFPSMITERVDQFVTRMYTQTREKIFSQLSQQPELLEKAKKEIENYSLRDITLKRSSGEEIKLDLMKFRRTGDFSNNPYLKNDDVLIFPPSDLDRNFFSISGAINKPGKYHFKDRDKLSDAIVLAEGINKAYEGVNKAEINRLSYDGEKMEVITADINSDYALQRGDRIIIVADETQRKEFSVRIIGEVKSPGEIPITKNSTTLKNVITKAGGFTDNASLKQAKVFTGNFIPDLLKTLYNFNSQGQEQSLMVDTTQFILNLKESILYRMSNVTYEDREYFKLENQLRSLLETGSIDFTKLDDENSDASKYIVKDGNIIFIPPKQNTVYVFGQVLKPGRISYQEGMDYKYYIERVGGLGEYAQDEDEIMIIKGDSQEWISPFEHKVNIEEGDYIYVPRELSYSFNYYIAVAGNYLSIVASAATIILLLVQFSK